MPAPRKITGTVPITIAGKTHHVAFTFRTLLRLEDMGIKFDESLSDKGIRGQLDLVLTALQTECDPNIKEDDVLDGMGLEGIAELGRSVQKLFEDATVPLGKTSGEQLGLSVVPTSN